jgi:hypothetical protein
MMGLLTLWVPSDHTSDEEYTVSFNFAPPTTVTTNDCFSFNDLNESSFGSTLILIFGL